MQALLNIKLIRLHLYFFFLLVHIEVFRLQYLIPFIQLLLETVDLSLQFIVLNWKLFNIFLNLLSYSFVDTVLALLIQLINQYNKASLQGKTARNRALSSLVDQ